VPFKPLSQPERKRVRVTTSKATIGCGVEGMCMVKTPILIV